MNSITGDPHNFGRRVRLTDDGRVFKPRSVTWEHLFLSKTPFREFLEKILLDTDAKLNPFSLFPTLTFETDYGLEKSGFVSNLVLNPIQNEDDISETTLSLVGSIIGLLCWFGITDLHSKNMAFGLDGKRRIIYCPLDIECIFEDIKLPSQTLLLPSEKVAPDKIGLSKIKQLFKGSPTLPQIAAICYGYWTTFLALSSRNEEIDKFIFGLQGFEKWPIRLVLRSTSIYQAFLDGRSTDEERELPFFKEEKEQLFRGDIPYFFRFPLSEKPNFYDTPQTTKPFEVTANEFKLLSIIQSAVVGNGIPRKNHSILQRAGLLQLAKFFASDHISVERVEFKEMHLGFEKDEIFFTDSKSHIEIACKR